jgi:thioredoxin reductase
MTMHPQLPIAVIGAGPIGLAAAAELMEHGLAPLILEAGEHPADAVRQWGHVRMFSPWSLNLAPAAARRLRERGWRAPDANHHPTGNELVRSYLDPLAATFGAALRLNARVIGVARVGHDLLLEQGRQSSPFVLQLDGPDGPTELEAKSVIDCSGTWLTPSPAGPHGLPVPGESAHADAISTGVPDILGAERDRFAGSHTLVVGSGHSAMNAVDALATLADTEGGKVTWAFRRAVTSASFGGGGRDQLGARGALGARARALVAHGRVMLLAPFAMAGIARNADGVLLVWARHGDESTLLSVDRIIVATGFRPDLRLLSEVRLDLDPVVQAPRALAPLIDPNLHSCGTVRPHGERELRQPERDFWIAGMKSYGRAPTFLLATGYEQVRSIAARLAGDDAAADAVHLVLPETGVCSTDGAAATDGCCTPATPQGVCCPPKPALEPTAPCCATAA